VELFRRKLRLPLRIGLGNFRHAWRSLVPAGALALPRLWEWLVPGRQEAGRPGKARALQPGVNDLLQPGFLSRHIKGIYIVANVFQIKLSCVE
jgi:hypothetical protein